MQARFRIRINNTVFKEEKMVVYSNISNFMKKGNISYRERVMLEILLATVCKGYDVRLFCFKNGEYKAVSQQMLAEYFFSKNILSKNKYLLHEDVDIANLKEDDVYFEVDGFVEENESDYYAKLERTNCQMYSYMYMQEIEQELPEQVKNQFKCMSTIYVDNNELAEMLASKNKKGMAKIEVLELEKFSNTNINDEFLKVERGLSNIIKEKNYVAVLFDCDNIRTNRDRMKEVRKEYADKKIIYLVPSQSDVDKYAKSMKNDSELGTKIYAIAGLDYYTVLNIYASADAVVVPKNCKSCSFEMINISKLSKNMVMI